LKGQPETSVSEEADHCLHEPWSSNSCGKRRSFQAKTISKLLAL
jgi:hypothetical protein